MTTYSPPPHSSDIKVSFPEEHVMLLVFNRPRWLNAMTPTMADSIKDVLDWFDEEPSLWVVIVTGEGRAFCAGADLLAWNERAQEGSIKDDEQRVIGGVDGFGSISRRSSSCKPMIAAVNGSAYGGGVETIMNCDLVIASEEATLALPEVKRGVCAVQGVIPRIAAIAGHQLASEMLLLGRNVSAHEAAVRFGFVNKVVPKSEVLTTALEWAKQITQNSPDSIQSTKRALVLSKEHGSVEDTVLAHVRSKENRRLTDSENIREGLKAFAEKRKPVWKNPAKL